MIHQTIRDRDVFRWSLRGHTYKHGALDPYWCCSQIAIAANGRLRDTYWGGSSERKSFAYDDDRLALTFLGNLDDYESRMPSVAAYYSPADIMDLRHANDSSSFYIRKGAPRNREAMLAEAERRLADAEERARLAASRAESARELIAKLKSGIELGEVWL